VRYEFAARLVTSGLTTLLFSVHGATARSHGREVGVAEAFEQTVAGIRNLVAAAPPGVELGANITLTKHNHEELAAVADLVMSLGLAWLNVQFLTPFGRATTRHAPDTAAAAAVTMRVIDAYADRMKLQVINLPFCFMPGYERHLAGDLGKRSRHMVFVNNETVNLAAYLAERRVHTDACAPCPHRAFCGGFYRARGRARAAVDRVGRVPGPARRALTAWARHGAIGSRRGATVAGWPRAAAISTSP
jgi:MoaA/NifB/PqqE/SkfB family radical SAM enzyme